MSAGYLYILINPSMPGLAKVGKTTRDPTNRVAELSGATGVATPFMLAYQQPVPDCNAAETWVHAELERKGHRVSANREFFNAPLHEIVALLSVAATIAPTATDVTNANSSADEQRMSLIEDLNAEGEKYWNGDGVLENKATALKHFDQASQLGDRIGSARAGMCYAYGGPGLKPNPEKAIEYYRKAIAQGLWNAHLYVAGVFELEGQPANAIAEWKKYFELAFKKRKEEGSGLRVKSHIARVVVTGAASYLRQVALEQLPHSVPNEHIALFAKEIIEYLEEERAAMRNYGQNGLAIEFLTKKILGGLGSTS
jgi:tetratricopeptide (TPR) repeat protein